MSEQLRMRRGLCSLMVAADIAALRSMLGSVRVHRQQEHVLGEPEDIQTDSTVVRCPVRWVALIVVEGTYL